MPAPCARAGRDQKFMYALAPNVLLLPCYTGTRSEPEGIRRLRGGPGLVEDGLGTRPFLEQQELLDSAYGQNRHYWKGNFVNELPDELIDELLEAVDLTAPRPAAHLHHVPAPWPGRVPDPAPASVLAEPELRGRMIANSAELYRQGGRGMYEEALILARPWGFALGDVTVPVHVFQGARDETVPVAMARHLAREIGTARLHLYPDDGHHLLYSHWPKILSALV